MKQFIFLVVSVLCCSPVLAAPISSDTETSPNSRSYKAILHPTFNKEACCKCWNDLYHNGASWEVRHPPRPCDGDCTCDWCGTNNANASYGTPCTGAGDLGNWGYCVANCDVHSSTPSGVSATGPSSSIVKTLPPTTLPTEHSNSIIMKLPPTTLPTGQSSSTVKTLPPATLWTETTSSKFHEHTVTSVSKASPPVTLPTHMSRAPPELKQKRQDQTVTYGDDPVFPTTDSSIQVITDTLLPTETDTTLFFGSTTDSASLAPTSSWNGGTTIENTGTLTFSGGTQTFTYGSETITLTFPPAATLSVSPDDNNLENQIDQRQFLPQTITKTKEPRDRPWTTVSELPVETTWYGGGPGFILTFPPEVAAATPSVEIDIEGRDRLWTTVSELPVETTWYGGGPGFTLTFPDEVAAATPSVQTDMEGILEVEKRQINTITWGESTLPATTYWGGDETITFGDETITFGFPPGRLGMSATVPNAEAEVTALPEIINEKRQVGVIITGGPWTEDNGATFTDYWGFPGEIVTLQGPHGEETLTLSGTPRHITATLTGGAAQARITGK